MLDLDLLREDKNAFLSSLIIIVLISFLQLILLMEISSFQEKSSFGIFQIIKEYQFKTCLKLKWKYRVYSYN